MEKANCCLDQKVSCKFTLCDIYCSYRIRYAFLFSHTLHRDTMHIIYLVITWKAVKDRCKKGRKTITVFPFQTLSPISVCFCSSVLRLKTVSIRPMLQKLSSLEAEKNVETNNDMAFSVLFAVNSNNKRFLQWSKPAGNTVPFLPLRYEARSVLRACSFFSD